ncbi:MAG: RsmB/NOP family class I SAM-dependent RNA methyltransferase, partial [Desulfatiglandales bacterium]
HQLKKIKGEILEKGLAQVQSEASQLAALILRPLPGQRILDLCSGLGTKAFHMAQLMEDRGEIISVDIDLSRLRELKRTGERLGVSIVQPICADATLGLTALIRGGFDRILLDAPCSNLGALGRKRELIFRLSPKRIESLAQLQLRLLKNAKILLNPMGYLLYVTCTVSRIENEDNVERFLASEPDMELVSPKSNFGLIPDELVKVPGFVKTFPHMEETDGFFYALFRKRERG